MNVMKNYSAVFLKMTCEKHDLNAYILTLGLLYCGTSEERTFHTLLRENRSEHKSSLETASSAILQHLSVSDRLISRLRLAARVSDESEI